MTALRALLVSESRVLLRDRTTFFFTFAFPLIFVLIFGFVMGGFGNVSRSTMGLFVSSDADRPTLDETLDAAASMALEEYSSLEEMQEAVTDRRIDFALHWDGASLRFLYDANRVQENFAFAQVAAGLSSDFNLRRQGAASAVSVEPIPVGEIASAGWFQLVLPGILAFGILSSGLFAVSGHLTAMKERKVLDRLIVTPMPPLALLVAIAAVRLAVAYVSTLITLFVGMGVFGLRYDVDWIRFAVLVACATVGTMGIGTIIALVVRRPSSASNVANALAIVMMFLAGIYFPVEFMPSFLRAISAGLPLTHLANAMRYATGVMDMAEAEFWAITAAFVGIAALLFPILARYVVRPLRQ